ncbi:MAG TPA: ABC transporter permease [Actinotalea sp.]|nr:ABC transporter permease [Actinotalea sp.]
MMETTRPTVRGARPEVGAAAPATDAGGTRAVRTLVFIRDRGIILLWLLLVVIFAVWAQPYFFSLTNAALVANAAALTALFAAAVAFGILSGALDLSIPASAALSSVVAGQILTAGGPTWLAVLAGLVSGSMVGLINGVLVQRGLNPLVVTIASLTSIGGIATLIAGGLAIPGINQLSWMGSQRYWGIPAPVFLVGFVYLLAWFFLTQTRAGARMQAVGGNVEAVRRVGISADRYRILGFMLGSLAGALGGLAVTAVTLQASPAASTSLLFTGITAVALSGMPLSGGRGSMPRVLVGALIIETINSALVIKGIEPAWTTVVTGVLLVLALIFERTMSKAVTARLTVSETAAPPAPQEA